MLKQVFFLPFADIFNYGNDKTSHLLLDCIAYLKIKYRLSSLYSSLVSLTSDQRLGR
jgi:hypothetical protein